MIDDTISIVTAIMGGFILLYGLCSLIIKEKLFISEASVAIACGIAFGPIGFNLINVDEWSHKDEFTREFTRIVIAIQVMAAGVALPKAYLQTELKSLAILIIPVMIWMWVVSGLCVWLVIPGLTYLESLMIASCFTPTDPVLANSIVQGHFAERHVPANVRHIISAESGANDGLGYPFLFLAIYLARMPLREALTRWTLTVLLHEIVISIAIGFAAGFAARKLLRYAQEKKIIDNESFLVFAVALALFLMGTVSLVGSDDLLACFIAGNSFTWDDWFRIETENSRLTEAVDMLLNLSVFVYIGAIMPWTSFINDAIELSFSRLMILAILVLFFRRLPIIVSLFKFIPAIHNWREALFTGWFGPIGVGAVFYYTVAMDTLDEETNARVRQVIGPIIYFMVLASVIIHGVTIPLVYLGTFATRTFTRSNVSSNTAYGTLSIMEQQPLTRPSSQASN